MIDLRQRAKREIGLEPADVRLLRPDGERWVRLYLEVEKDAKQANALAGRPAWCWMWTNRSARNWR